MLAISLGDVMILKLKLGNSGVEIRRSFKVKPHGCSSRQIKHELANISVKVTLSTILNVAEILLPGFMVLLISHVAS